MGLDTINNDLRVNGHLSAQTMTVPASAITNAQVAADAGIERTKLGVTDACVYTIPHTAMRVWDNLAALLPVTAANDDLGVTSTTYGTNAALINTGDVKTTNSTRYCRFMFALPAEYEAGDNVTIRIAGGMLTTVASSACTVDVECWEIEGDGTLGASDLCATAAQSINSLTFADKDFTITPTSLMAGDQIDVRLAIAYNDVATGTAVIGAIAKVSVLCDVRG